jgi:hypothetical protein
VRSQATAHNAESSNSPEAGERPTGVRSVRRGLMDLMRTQPLARWRAAPPRSERHGWGGPFTALQSLAGRARSDLSYRSPR